MSSCIVSQCHLQEQGGPWAVVLLVNVILKNKVVHGQLCC